MNLSRWHIFPRPSLCMKRHLCHFTSWSSTTVRVSGLRTEMVPNGPNTIYNSVFFSILVLGYIRLTIIIFTTAASSYRTTRLVPMAFSTGTFKRRVHCLAELSRDLQQQKAHCPTHPASQLAYDPPTTTVRIPPPWALSLSQFEAKGTIQSLGLGSMLRPTASACLPFADALASLFRTPPSIAPSTFTSRPSPSSRSSTRALRPRPTSTGCRRSIRTSMGSARSRGPWPAGQAAAWTGTFRSRYSYWDTPFAG